MERALNGSLLPMSDVTLLSGCFDPVAPPSVLLFALYLANSCYYHSLTQ